MPLSHHAQVELDDTHEEFADALSGAPVTPRVRELEQALDRHGTNDTDEFGANPQHTTVANVVVNVRAPSIEALVGLAQTDAEQYRYLNTSSVHIAGI